MRLGLLLSGMASGAGQAAEKGLQTWQQGELTSRLQQERDAMENERLKQTFGHQEQMQKEQQAFQSAQDQLREENANARHQSTLGAGILQTSLTNQRIADEGEKTREHTEKVHGQDVASKEKIAERQAGLEEKKISEAEKYHTGYIEALKGRVNAALARGGKAELDPGVKEQVQYQMKLLEGLQKQVESGTLDPLEGEKGMKKIGEEIYRLTGAAPAPAPAVPQVKSRYLEKLTPRSEPANTPAPAGAISSTAPNLQSFGNPAKPTKEDIAKFYRDYERANRTGNASQVIADWRGRFGKLPYE
jgi:hypothetical protein